MIRRPPGSPPNLPWGSVTKTGKFLFFHYSETFYNLCSANPVWMKELFFFVVLTDASGVAALVTDYASDEVDDVSCDGLLEINFGECG